MALRSRQYRKRGLSSHPIDRFSDCQPKISHRISTLSVEERLAESGVPEKDEPAEGDEGEEEVVHEGGHPPHHHGGDAEGLS